MNGQGVPQDDKQAVEWMHKAADQGLAVAQNGLGSAFENGWGVSKDLQQARQWYEKGAAQGDEEAKQALSRLQ